MKRNAVAEHVACNRVLVMYAMKRNAVAEHVACNRVLVMYSMKRNAVAEHVHVIVYLSCTP